MITVKRMKLDPTLHHKQKLTQNDQKCNLHDLGLGNGFLPMKSKAQVPKEKIRDFIKIKNFCASNDTIKKVKRQPTEWE